VDSHFLQWEAFVGTSQPVKYAPHSRLIIKLQFCATLLADVKKAL
jgi:hypothetical protein